MGVEDETGAALIEIDKVRVSKAGHAFHEARALRTALELLLLRWGPRIQEAVTVQRDGLQWWPAEDETPATWRLGVVGKVNKERFVPVINDTIEALREHWQYRVLDFDNGAANIPLVAPIVIPPTPTGRDELGVTETGEVTRVAGYTVRAARRVVARARPLDRATAGI